MLSSFSGQYRSKQDGPFDQLDESIAQVWQSFYEDNAVLIRNNASLHHVVLRALGKRKDSKSTDPGQDKAVL
ncbi:MAG: hypothetical protein GYA55_14445 [SAR324 cluster bacterium]|uniref:Uncharacterized protein n=1 Tax=SAR324 cluster bacterium TaxID=2024889 RepID=A0A7X9IL38_9DELT|nr:hypothetical protein [SAR324 cluster bacterium]